MQQNLLLYCMHIQRDLFGGLASILGCPRAFSRLPTLEDWPFRPLRGLKGQISRLAASLRPRQLKISARQPKKSCCLCIQCNKRPMLYSFSSFDILKELPPLVANVVYQWPLPIHLSISDVLSIIYSDLSFTWIGVSLVYVVKHHPRFSRLWSLTLIFIVLSFMGGGA